MRKPLHVIVIGAGTGGMCLAHGLRRAGIQVSVYERDRTRTDGLHGYRVGIDPHGSRSLKACLPPDLYATFVATCAQEPENFAFLDEKLRPTLTFPMRLAVDDVNGEKSVSRMTLRQVLFTGMDDVIHFDKEFTHYTTGPGDRVTAHFTDGSSATGDLLVAADGTNSAVRRQYLPQARIEDSGILAIAAKVPITAETAQLVPANLQPGIGMVLAPHGLNCILHWMRFPWDDAGAPTAGGSDATLLAHWPGLLFDNTRDYINWGISGVAERFPDDILRLGGKELIDATLAMTPTWSPRLRRLFALADPSTVFTINIRTSVPPEPWQPGTVTLLGDAIHTMTPGLGVGANTALRDAARLVRQLSLVRDGKPLLQAVSDYERRMIEYGFKAVGESKKRFGRDQLVHKPVVGRLALAGQRTFLRLTDRVPALKRKMLDDLYRSRGAEDDADLLG
jgi:2-polyprenyl-6-methoxyphenol hydroxylase-like FAD-dependent oxidoreductase